MDVTAETKAQQRILALRDAQAVTIVGGNERNGTTELLLSSIRHADTPFPGRINMVSRSARSVFGIPAVAELADVEGDLGVGWFITGADNTVQALQETDRRFDAVVVFSGGFGEAGNHDAQGALADWAQTTGTPLFGPQSIGFGFIPERRNFLDLRWKDGVRPGPVALLAHSGGILTSMCNAISSDGPGVRAAFALGNEASQSFIGVADALLDDDGVELVAAYVEHFRSPTAFARLAAKAAERGKPLVLLVGGITETGQAMAASHTGAIATPFRVIQGIAEQFGVVLVEGVVDLVDAVSTLQRHGRRRFGRGGVGWFSNTQGLNVILADELARRGRGFTPATTETVRAVLGEDPHGDGNPGDGNPVDGGAGALGRPEEFRERVARFASDANFDILSHQLHQRPNPEHTAHVGRYRMFNEVAAELGKPVVAGFGYDDAPADDPDADVSTANGVHQLVTKVAALSDWSAAIPPFAGPVPRLVPIGEARVLIGDAATSRLAPLPVQWAPEHVIAADLPLDSVESPFPFPVVLKADSGDAHRAKAGAVLTGIRDAVALRAAVAYLRARFDADIALSPQLPFDREFFIGASRDEEGAPVVVMGAGGADVGSAARIRMLPLTAEQAEAFTGLAFPGVLPAGYGARLVAGIAEVMDDPAVVAIDLNPLVVSGDGLTVLDGKVHVIATEDAR